MDKCLIFILYTYLLLEIIKKSYAARQDDEDFILQWYGRKKRTWDTHLQSQGKE